nr:aldehyde dehydrogenase family protein [Rhodococcus sp. X156]
MDGERRAGSGERIEVTNPATGELLATVPAGTATDVDDAVRAARRVFASWSQVPVAERAAVVRRISEGIAARRDEIAATISAEMGSPIGFATAVQASMPGINAGVFADVAESFPWSEEIGNSLVLREPIGVVGAITPWNYPLHQVVAKVAPALLAGNTVVLKPSEVAPLSAGILVEIAEQAGLPAGALNLVHGTGEVVGEAISRHPDIDMVSFTGSTAAGKKVSIGAADTVKRVALELGGKSACVVLPDADFAVAAQRGLGNGWINGGQTCTAWTRMLVPAERQQEMLDLLREAAAAYQVGDPSDPATRIGPMSSAAQQEKVRSYLDVGVAEGATVAYGGPQAGADLPTDGAYVQPTIFADVRPDMRIAQEEIFGPVLSVMPYQDLDEAAEIANSTVYGLAGAVFAGDTESGVEFAKRMRTGQVDVNGGSFNLLAPFGGYGQSGNGRELGRFGLEEFCEVKSIQR